VVVLKDLGYCRLSGEVVERQGEYAETGLCAEAVPMMPQPEP